MPWQYVNNATQMSIKLLAGFNFSPRVHMAQMMRFFNVLLWEMQAAEILVFI